MATYSKEFLESLRRKAPISSVVQNFTPVVKKSGRLMALCPFHEEKTPSFSVTDEKGVYYCFGCGEKGDVFAFLMNKQNLSFAEAVKTVADIAGVSLPTSHVETAEQRARNKLSAYAQRIAEFYRKYLWESSEAGWVRDYLHKRGFSQEICDAFCVGFSPSNGKKTFDLWARHGVSLDALKDIGCVVEASGQIRDRFAGRLMFPIKDAHGAVIGFSGRSLEKGKRVAKYVNSPETALFKKKLTLYNLHQVSKMSQKKLYLVEGFTDVMRLYQKLGCMSVACMGTAFSQEQLLLLWSYCDTPVVWFDSDQAGALAAQKLLDKAMPLFEPNKSLEFVNVVGGEDPDSWFQGRENKDLEELPITSAADFFWNVHKSKKDLSTPESWAEFEESLLACVRNIKHAGVQKYYKRYIQQRLFDERPERTMLRQTTIKKRRLDTEVLRQKIILLMMCAYPHLLDSYDEMFAQVSFTSESWSNLQRSILEGYVALDDVSSWGLVKYLLRAGFDLRRLYQISLYTHAPFLFERSLDKQRLQCVCDDLLRKMKSE